MCLSPEKTLKTACGSFTCFPMRLLLQCLVLSSIWLVRSHCTSTSCSPTRRRTSTPSRCATRPPTSGPRGPYLHGRHVAGDVADQHRRQSSDACWQLGEDE
ncbi:hypothetical protein B0T24DRAFT_121942 [Lasiosphaeria ovina]|uniref:Secreted protein n=1 Tax=Lasiosphaeria ovina TaxID=92902 RepID=A0AAE0JSN1_9PEZI|nr:hypothetical protein B0T24DRAFT_121942 [Lasiosphaeria ovina]